MDEIRSTQKLKKFFGEPVKKTSSSSVLKNYNQESNLRNIEHNTSCFTQCGRCSSTILHENSRNVISNHSFKVNDNCSNFRDPDRFECPSFMRNKTNEINKLTSNINSINKDPSSFLTRKFGLQGSKGFFENKLNSENFKYKGLSGNFRNDSYRPGNFRNDFCRPGNFGKAGPYYKDNTLNAACSVLEGENLQEKSISNNIISGSNVTSSCWARNSTLPAQLPRSYNCEKYQKDLSNVNPFNVISFSRKESDVLTKSRFPFYNEESQKDSCSIASSFINATSGKAQISNLLENLHHRILNISPNLPVEAVRLEFERAKEELESVAEFSFAHTIRDNDGASIVSNISKQAYPPFLSTINEKISVSLKSGKDVLKSLQSKNIIIGKPTVHQSEKKKKDVVFSSSENELNLSDDEDSALLFKKPKPFSLKKKISSSLLKIKTPPVVRKLSPRIANKIFSLKHWRPLSIGSDLLFCGVNEKGETVRTEAVKKRISNLTVELIGGVTCNLIGSPVSTLPKKIIVKLKNGLPRQWKLLQKELVSNNIAEKQETSRASIESEKNRSSKTRRVIHKKKDVRKVSTPKKEKNSKNKKEDKTRQNSPLKTSKLVATKKLSPGKVAKFNKEKPKSTKAEKVTIIKNVKDPPANETPEVNKSKGEICKTRSGRVIVRPNTYNPSVEYQKKEAKPNSPQEEHSEKVSRKRRKEDVQQNKSEEPNLKKKKQTVECSEKSEKQKTKKQTSKDNKKTVSHVEEEFEFNLDDILIPQITKIKGKLNLSKSQLRSINCETPPLQYFNRNLNLSNSASSAAPSPDWCISQRTASEVKRFQKRKATNRLKKIVDKKKKNVPGNNITTPKNSFANKDLKNIVDWFAEKDVKTPVGNSRVVKYMIPKRNNIEEDCCSETEENED